MLRFWVDDSKDDRNLVLGGLLAKTEAWDAFYEPWNARLREPLGLPYWRSSDAWAGNPPFEALADDRPMREWMQAELANVVIEMGKAVTALCVHMPHSAYMAEMKGRVILPRDRGGRNERRRASTFYESELSILVAALVTELDRHLRAEGMDDEVQIVLESASDKSTDDYQEQMANAAIKYLRTDPTGRLWSATVAKGKNPKTRPLEAADLFAWCSRHRARAVVDFDRIHGRPNSLDARASLMYQYVAESIAAAIRARARAGDGGEDGPVQ